MIVEGLDRDANNEGLCIIIVLAADDPIMVKCGAWTGKDGLTVKGGVSNTNFSFFCGGMQNNKTKHTKQQKEMTGNGLC